MLQTNRFIAGCLLAGWLVSEASPALAQDVSPWKAGLASVCITPEEPVRMSGYASRKEPSKGVASDLYAKALVLEDGAGHIGVLVTTDVIGFRKPVADSICALICEATGLKRSQILLNSSHTHTGPVLELDASQLNYEGEQAAATVRYTKGLRHRIVELVRQALDARKPARLSRGVGMAPFVMNRREFTTRGVVLGFNPRGHVDRSAPVLRIDGPDGSLRAVLFGAACHNTTLGSRDYLISGDFAGYAQSLVESKRPGVTAMFMQGCAGDANPYPRGEEAIARRHGRVLGEEVLRVLDEKLMPVLGPLQTHLQEVKLPLQSRLTKADIQRLQSGGGGWRSFVADGLLAKLESDGRLLESYATPIALWQFGDSLTLVGLSGEVVVDYIYRLEDILDPRTLWVAAYCNDVYGYLPSARVLQQGGYETRGLYYGGFGLFAPSAENVLVQHVKQMAATAREKPEPRREDGR